MIMEDRLKFGLFFTCLVISSSSAGLIKRETGPTTDKLNQTLDEFLYSECKNKDVKAELTSGEQFEEVFSICRKVRDFKSPTYRMCLTTLVSLIRLCNDTTEEFSFDDIKNLDKGKLCDTMNKTAVAFPVIKSDCGLKNVAACNITNATVMDLREKAENFCNVCLNNTGLCKKFIFSLKAVSQLQEAAELENEIKPTPQQTAEVTKGSVAEADKDENPKDGAVSPKSSLTIEKPKAPEIRQQEEEEDKPENVAEQPENGPTGNESAPAGNDDPAGNGDDDDKGETGGRDDDDDDGETGAKDGADTPDHQVPAHIENHMSIKEAEEANSYFSYLILVSIVAIAFYLVFHNKQKILALILEGRRGRKARGGRRRTSSSSAQYRKLDNNLEEAMGPSSNDGGGRHIIY